jgi:hypothetical protein
LTKLRQRLTKSSGGTRGLDDRVVEDDGDTCRHRGGGISVSPGGLVVWATKPPADGFSGLGLKTRLEFRREREDVCSVIAKQSREDRSRPSGAWILS